MKTGRINVLLRATRWIVLFPSYIDVEINMLKHITSVQ